MLAADSRHPDSVQTALGPHPSETRSPVRHQSRSVPAGGVLLATGEHDGRRPAAGGVRRRVSVLRRLHRRTTPGSLRSPDGEWNAARYRRSPDRLEPTDGARRQGPARGETAPLPHRLPQRLPESERGAGQPPASDRPGGPAPRDDEDQGGGRRLPARALPRNLERRCRRPSPGWRAGDHSPLPRGADAGLSRCHR